MGNTKEQSYSIGQVVYILSDKAETIVPAIVVEEVVVKKLNGNTVSWKVAIGPAHKEKIVASDEISGTVYTSLDDIKEEMNKRLSNFISNLVGDAEKRTQLWYGDRMKPQTSTMSNETRAGEKFDPSSLINNIENDGSDTSSVKTKMTTEAVSNSGPLNSSTNEKEDLRSKLRQLATPAENEEEIDENTEFVVTDDGRRLPVKYVENQ